MKSMKAHYPHKDSETMEPVKPWCIDLQLFLPFRVSKPQISTTTPQSAMERKWEYLHLKKKSVLSLRPQKEAITVSY